MTNTTAVHQLNREQHVYSPTVLPQPGIATFVGQAAVGCCLGAFLILIARILIEYHPLNGWAIYSLPFLLAAALILGALPGLLIWACTRLAHGPLHPLNRLLIGVFILALSCFSLLFFWLDRPLPSEEVPWLIAWVVVPGIIIGLITGSRLRLGRELVRVGEARGRVLRILAGLTGAVLRVAVVFLFMEYLTLLIAAVQIRVFGMRSEIPQKTMIQIVLLFCHLAVSVVIVFVRMRFSALGVLAVIAATPLFVTFREFAEMDLMIIYFVLGYTGVWGMFLLTRSQEIDRAVSVLAEEFRYYLID